MKTYFKVLSIILIFPFIVSAQISSSLHHVKSSSLTFNSGKNVPILLASYNQRVHNFSFDGKYLTTQLRGYRGNTQGLKDKGSVVRYDLINNQSNFDFKFSYKYESFLFSKGYTIYYTATDSYMLNNENGKNKYKMDHNIYIIDSTKQIGMGYKIDEFPSNINRLEGIDLASGTKIWERNINRDYGWNDSYSLNDSTYLIISSGLHTVNPNTGKGWSYDAKTGNYGAANAFNVGLKVGTLVAVGLVGFVILGPSIDINQRSCSCSNALIVDNNIFFSSFKKLAKLNKKTGELSWEIDIPKNGETKLWIQNNELYLLNTGKIMKGTTEANYSEPYFARYNIENGDQIASIELQDNLNRLVDYRINEDTATFVFNNQIKRYFVSTNELIDQHKINVYTSGYLLGFPNKQYYHFQKEQFNPIKEDSTFLMLFNYGSIKKINHKYEVKESIEKEELFEPILSFKNYQVLSNQTDTYLINSENEIIYGPFKQENIKFENNRLMYSNGIQLIVFPTGLF
ncbi:MAG: hypothetical protein DWP98_02375 [Bacteroidetes bacterium]|nr:MAG: hypothetical protein DWP98_02375 [Bacteroidota bacterium]MBL1145314.1 hypothetical protein [Bacteroidota bacterium]NOG58111.1 hypothetical protein [Bacteroidota bacterium]